MAEVKESIASDKLIKWLEKRKDTLQKEYNNIENLDFKKMKGARLKQIKDCLYYIQTH